jgi:hypothetical protein
MKPCKYLTTGSSIYLSPLPSGNSVTFTVTSVSEPFRGIITKAYSKERNVEMPYDPWLRSPEFTI